MKLRSLDFVGQWPTGIHWMPGEERELPPGYPVPTEPPPEGLILLDSDTATFPAVVPVDLLDRDEVLQ